MAALYVVLEPERLSAAAARALRAQDAVVFLSAVSVWELAIKASIGKLELARPFDATIARMVAELGAAELPVTFEHAKAVRELPLLHRDPFDRLLIAQARAEGLTLVSSDPQVARYPVATLW